MGMYFTQHNPFGDTHLVDATKENEQRIVTERTEDLPEMQEDSETKKRFKERGGNPYIKEAGSIESDEFIVLGRDYALKLGLDKDGNQNLYKVLEDGTHTPILTL